MILNVKRKTGLKANDDLCPVTKSNTHTDTFWMRRCFDLARRGIGYVSPNPPVGAVVVHDDRLLAEGYHQNFGGPHAEVNALQRILPEDKSLLPRSTLYVSLEPCCITGKTGPCTDLIIENKISRVVISVQDPNPAVAGNGVDKLRRQGIEVITGILPEEGQALIRPFTTNMQLHRPHVCLKWAQSKYGMAGTEGKQVWFSDPSTTTWTHRQRAKVDAILVGARTIETDDPALTTRTYPGDSPQRVIYDPNGRLSGDYKVFNEDVPVHYYSAIHNDRIHGKHIRQIRLGDVAHHLEEILRDLTHHQIGILLVEGGPYLQKQFIKQDLWDEAWVIQTQHPLQEGILAPNVHGRLLGKETAAGDTIIGILNLREK